MTEMNAFSRLQEADDWDVQSEEDGDMTVGGNLGDSKISTLQFTSVHLKPSNSDSFQNEDINSMRAVKHTARDDVV